MPKHFSNEPKGKHFGRAAEPGEPAESNNPSSSAKDGSEEPTPPDEQDATTLLGEETTILGDETTPLSRERRRATRAESGKGGADAPARQDEVDPSSTVALTPEQAQEAGQTAEATHLLERGKKAGKPAPHAPAGSASPQTAPVKGQSQEGGPSQTQTPRGPVAAGDSGNLFAPLGKRSVAAAKPDTPSYEAKPSPYLSQRQAARDPEKAKRRHSMLIGVALAAAAVAGIGGGAYYVHQQLASQVQTTTTQFETARITRGEFLDTIDGSTTLEPIATSDVSNEVTGTIKDLKVQDGTEVKKGDTLFTLDNPTITAATETAKEQRDQAQSDVDDKTQQVQDAQAKLDEARQTIQDSLSKIYALVGKTPEATTFNVDTNGDGTPDALDVDGDGKADGYDTNGDGIVDMVDTNGDGTPDVPDSNGDGKIDSASDLPSTLNDQQKSDLAAAESDLTKARSELSAYQTTVDTGNSALKAAQDNLSSLQTAYDKALAQEKKLTVTAPITGTVHDLSSSLTEGGTLDTAGTVCRIDDISSFTLTIQASERKIRRAKAGQEVRLTFPAISDLNLTTTVDSVATKKTDGTDTYAITMTIEDPDDRLEVGTTVDASVVLQQIEDVLIVPADAIHTQGQDTYVDVLLDPVRGIETLVQVNVVTSNEDNAVVEGESIQEGNAVVLSKTEASDNANAS